MRREFPIKAHSLNGSRWDEESDTLLFADCVGEAIAAHVHFPPAGATH
jgi:hypothetical protein